MSIFLVTFFSFLLTPLVVSSELGPPHIIFILADDLVSFTFTDKIQPYSRFGDIIVLMSSVSLWLHQQYSRFVHYCIIILVNELVSLVSFCLLVCYVLNSYSDVA